MRHKEARIKTAGVNMQCPSRPQAAADRSALSGASTQGHREGEHALYGFLSHKQAASQRLNTRKPKPTPHAQWLTCDACLTVLYERPPSFYWHSFDCDRHALLYPSFLSRFQERNHLQTTYKATGLKLWFCGHINYNIQFKNHSLTWVSERFSKACITVCSGRCDWKNEDTK